MNFILVSAAMAQAASYYDPAQAYNRLIIERGDGMSQQLVGNFKVIGSSHLYGGNHLGDVYFKNGSVKNVPLTYDTYKQVLSLHIGDDGKSLVKQLNELDSLL